MGYDLSMRYTFERLFDRVYRMHFKCRYDLNMTFLRYQEFYESPNGKFYGSKFTIVEYMEWYTKEHDPDDRTFTYPKDWSGFNIPVPVIKSVHDKGIDDPNHYDRLMMRIYKRIVKECGDDNAYLIGTYENKDNKKESTSTLRHELAHALYSINAKYKAAVDEALDAMPKGLWKEMTAVLRHEGYNAGVFHDELQAYIATGECGYFDDIECESDKFDKALNEARAKIKRLHRKHIKLLKA
jgi:hypothetical protein